MYLHAEELRIRFPEKKLMLKVLANVFAMKTLTKSSKNTIPEVMVRQSHDCPEALHVSQNPFYKSAGITCNRIYQLICLKSLQQTVTSCLRTIHFFMS